MSYISKTLGQGERIVARAHFHFFWWLWPWLVLGLPLGAFLALVMMREGKLALEGIDVTTVPSAVDIALLGVLALALIFFLSRTITLDNTEIAVTNRRLVKKTGWLMRNTEEIELKAVEGVKLRQTAMGQAFGWGSMTIEGTGVDNMKLPVIGNPLKFRRAIETALAG